MNILYVVNKVRKCEMTNDLFCFGYSISLNRNERREGKKIGCRKVRVGKKLERIFVHIIYFTSNIYFRAEKRVPSSLQLMKAKKVECVFI